MTGRPTVAQVCVGLLGAMVLGYAAWLVADLSLTTLRGMAIWFLGGVVLHDGVFVPLSLLALAVGARVVPVRLRGALAAGLVVLVTVTVGAIPVLGGFSAGKPDLLDRDYGRGWLIFAGLVFLGVVVAAVRHRPGDGKE